MTDGTEGAEAKSIAVSGNEDIWQDMKIMEPFILQNTGRMAAL